MMHGSDNVILACGPHCSGKTFNITGWNHKIGGIASRLIEEMLTPCEDDHAKAITYAMSCVEIKGNRAFDLLSKNWKQPCLTKNVSRHAVSAAEVAKRMLWEAHSKRTAVVRDDDYWRAASSHECDFVVTLFRHVPAPEGESRVYHKATRSKCSKVHIIELAGVGPITSKSYRHQIQANRTVLEIGQFLGHIANVNTKDNGDSIKDCVRSTTLTLLKYCQGSFTKLRTTLRVICHIRPELAFLNSNISVLELGGVFRKLPNNVINVPFMEPGVVELYKQMEHLTCELCLYRTVKGIGSMVTMTATRHEWLRNKVLDFLKSKSDDDIVLSKWSYVDGYTVLSVFKEYYDLIMADGKTVDRFELVPFALKSSSIDKNEIRLTAETMRQSVHRTLAPLDGASSARIKYWDAFVASDPTVLSRTEELAADVRDAHRTCEIFLGTMLDVHEKLLRTRDRMDKLRRKRHLSGNEQYDENMNGIVPVEEKSMFQNVKQTDKQMMKANDDFIKTQKHLNRTLLNYSKLKDSINTRFEKYLTDHTSYVNITDGKPSVNKFTRSMRNQSRFKKAQSRVSRKLEDKK